MQALRDFWRFHFLKVLLILVAIQLGVVAWMQVRNHKPEAVFDEVYVVEGQSVKIQPLRNDIDKDDEDVDSLQIARVGSPLYGKLTESGKYLIYEAEYGLVGVDSFVYVVSDGRKESKEAFIKINVEKNLEPIANNDYVQMYVGNYVDIDALGNDSDREGDSLFISEFSKPEWGTIEQVDGKLRYIPEKGIATIDSFHYVLSDGFTKAEKATVVIDVKDKKYECYPWLNTDVGNVQQQGSVECKSGSFVVKASGSDIWDGNDGFNFTYQKASGNCEMLLKVDKLEDTHEWAKAGIVFRQDLSAGSKNVLAVITSKNGTGFQRRSVQNNSTDGFGGKQGVVAPYWLKLNRKGNEFIAYCSPDGLTWEEFGKCELELDEEIYIGLALTSHDNSKLGEAVFSNLKIKK